MTEFLDMLSAFDIEFERSYDLSCCSSFRIGGPCDIAVFPKSEEELSLVISKLKKSNIRFDVIGRGSNVLFADEGYRGVIVFTKNMNEMFCNGTKIRALCGVKLSSLANLARDNSLSGLEFAHGIPGSVGGAVTMNAGAFGGDIKSIVVNSRALDVGTGETMSIIGDENNFGYRRSVYTENKNLICLSAEFELEQGDIDEINAKMRQNSTARREKQPIELPSCGSFFKRPEGFFAGKLIEDCGLKGFSVGGAQISQKHAGFIVNTGNATARDVMELGAVAERVVFEKFGVKLEREVKYIG